MKKHALCIGINNYPGTDMDLHGCVNDAADWAAMLAGRGFQVERLLNAKATKVAMVHGITKTIAGAATGDIVVISFSGHGTYELDISGDEASGFDQALCPYDLETAGQALVDDEIHALFQARKPGVQIVLITDSCHSGSVNRAIEARQPPFKRYLAPEDWMPADRLAAARKRAAAGAGTGAARQGTPLARAISRDAGDLLLAGCEDGEENFSYDAEFSGRPNGAFTFYALQTLQDLPKNATYADWHAQITKVLPSVDYPQSPQLGASAAARKRIVFS